MEERQPKKYFEFMWEILIFLHVNPSMCVYFLKSKLVHHPKNADFMINNHIFLLDFEINFFPKLIVSLSQQD